MMQQKNRRNGVLFAVKLDSKNKSEIFQINFIGFYPACLTGFIGNHLLKL